jgi:hypothetical protein
MAPPNKAEQKHLEALWAASARAYGDARRRQNAAEWAAHHERLAGAFREGAARHEREQERYHQILQDICAIKRGEGIEP